MSRGGAVVAGALLALVAGCTATPAGDPAPTTPAAPPPPPAACLLDGAALAAATGVAWTVDETTASDTRCVYDPAGATGTDFVAVDLAPAGPGLDTLAQVCAADTRTPVGVDGFVCRLAGDSVFAALVREGRVVTIAASAVPAATTAELLATAFGEQLAGIR